MKAIIHRAYQLAWALLAITVLCMTLGSTPAVAAWLQHRTTASSADPDPPGYPAADAIVVLGGGEVINEGKAQHWDPDATRLGVGRALLRARRAPVILLSGGDGEAAQMAARLILRGVPQTRILVENRSRNTRENAVYSAPILHRIGAQRILLVTSDIHMRRAAACFSKLGFEVLQAPVRELAVPGGDDFWQQRERALVRSGHCVHEIVGLWLYELCGWA